MPRRLSSVSGPRHCEWPFPVYTTGNNNDCCQRRGCNGVIARGESGVGREVRAGLNDWLSVLSELGEHGQDGVLITVAETRGSTPRETGTKMLVTPAAVVGTIGGGNLEYKAIEFARERLCCDAVETNRCELRRFPLGPALGQCCGGVAILHFEYLTRPLPAWIAQLAELRSKREAAVVVGLAEGIAGAEKLVVSEHFLWGGLDEPALEEAAAQTARSLLAKREDVRLARPGDADRGEGEDPLLLFEPHLPIDFHIMLFGAGHVGRALVRILGDLPCVVTWIDSREDQFPRDLPANVTVSVREAPDLEVAAAPRGSYFLIMTHSHPLDQNICERVLRRDDFHYCGLIGSQSKRRKFEKRLTASGVEPASLAKLTCPIGVEGIGGKQPAEIAVAVAAQLLQVQARVPVMPHLDRVNQAEPVEKRTE